MAKPQPKSAYVDGATFKRARDDKEEKYGDVYESPHAELLVLAAEVGGRWNDTTLQFVRQLAKHKVRTVPMVLQRSAELAWADRWWTLLGVAVQDALAASVLAPSTHGLVIDASCPPLPEVDQLLDEERL